MSAHKSCYVSWQNRCAIVCLDAANEETWIDVNDDAISESVKQDYEKCRHSQLSSFREALQLGNSSGSRTATNSANEPTFRRKKTRQELEDFADDEPLVADILPRSKRQSVLCEDNPAVISKMNTNYHNFERVKSNVLQILTTVSDVKFVRYVGAGMHAQVYEICNPELSSQRFIVKVGATEHEFKMQKVFYQHGLAVEPVGFLNEVLIMGKIDGILSDLLKEEQPQAVLDNLIVGLVDVITRMVEDNLIHMDLHFGNIGYQINIETRVVHFVLLDFANAWYGASSSYALKQLRESCREIENPKNRKYICDKLYGIPFDSEGPFRYSDINDV
jgi:hypothetical protein